MFHICNFGPKILHNYNLAPEFLHNCKLAPELLHNCNLTLEFLKNSNQVPTVDFSRNSLLSVMFRAELGVGLVGPGDCAPCGAMGFAGGGVMAADRGILAVADVAREFYAKFVAVYGISMVAIDTGGVDQRWGSLGTLYFFPIDVGIRLEMGIFVRVLKIDVGCRRFGLFPAKGWRP